MHKLGSKQYPNLLNEQKNPQTALAIENLLSDSNIGAEGAVIAIKKKEKLICGWGDYLHKCWNTMVLILD